MKLPPHWEEENKRRFNREMAKQFGMVLDVDRCIGCYACTVSCKMAYGTRPGVNYNAVDRVEWGEFPDAHQVFKQTMCMHCKDAACVEACPTGATYTTEEGVVVMDYDKCIGCGACVLACPYDERHLVKDEETHYEGTVLPFEEEAADRLNIVEKCTFCYGRVQAGEQPMCTVHCPGQCRIFGDVNDPESEISKYIKERNATHVEGTSIYYVIPEGMDRGLLPPNYVKTVAAAPVEEPKVEEPAAPVVEEKESNTGAIAAGLIGAAVVAGGGYAYMKNKNKDGGKGGEK